MDVAHGMYVRWRQEVTYVAGTKYCARQMHPRRAGRTKLACSGDEKCDIIREGWDGEMGEAKGRSGVD